MAVRNNRRQRSKRLTEAELETIQTLLEDGVPVRQIAGAIGCSEYAVTYQKKKLKGRPRSTNASLQKYLEWEEKLLGPIPPKRGGPNGK